MGEQMILSECLEKQIIETDARKGVVKKVCSVVLLTTDLYDIPLFSSRQPRLFSQPLFSMEDLYL